MDAALVTNVVTSETEEGDPEDEVEVLISLLATILFISSSKGRTSARKVAARVDVDLNARLIARTNGRWAECKAFTHHLNFVAPPQTAQPYIILGMNMVLYKVDKDLLEIPQVKRQHLFIMKRRRLEAWHLAMMWSFQVR